MKPFPQPAGGSRYWDVIMSIMAIGIAYVVFMGLFREPEMSHFTVSSYAVRNGVKVTQSFVDSFDASLRSDAKQSDNPIAVYWSGRDSTTNIEGKILDRMQSTYPDKTGYTLFIIGESGIRPLVRSDDPEVVSIALDIIDASKNESGTYNLSRFRDAIQQLTIKEENNVIE